MPKSNRNWSLHFAEWLASGLSRGQAGRRGSLAVLLLLAASVAWGQTASPPSTGRQSDLLAIRPALQSVNGRSEVARERILGTIIEQRKYSVRIASGEQDYEVFLPDGIPIDQRLDRPQLDFATGLLTQELIASQVEGGEPGQQVSLKEPFPQPLGLQAEFAHQNERRRLLEREPKQVVRYRLLPFDQLTRLNPGELELLAEVRPSTQPGKVRLEAAGQSYEVQLGSRDARLGGRTIADLKPLQTEVEIEAEWIADRWVAQEVVYRRITRQIPTELPRLLVLGDEVSLSYLNSLRQQLAGKFSVYHPPENCRGSAQWSRLPLWLGPYRQSGQHWDVILFNFGLGDLSTDEATYREAARQAAAALQPATKRLIWIATTPLPDNWQPAGAGTEGLTRAAAQIKLQRLNQISREVYSQLPNLELVDLTDAFEAERSGQLSVWFAGQSPDFSQNQSGLIAAWIARAIQGEVYEDE